MKNKSRRFPLLRTRGYWLTACVYLVIFVLPPVVYASGCETEYTTEGMIAGSSLIFRGTVLSVIPAGERAEVVKFKISQTYKGAKDDEADIVSRRSGDCWQRFKVGEETVVFAFYWMKEDAQAHVDCCIMQKYRRDSAQYDLALEEYRRKRDGLAAEVKRQGPNKKVLREQLVFLLKLVPFGNRCEEFC
ncbi:MAG: hypothetical protein NT087_04825 [Deltaproteobacteria bacterium]|nr:hypothetical protein [Deltaproteobacteria bacterium]